MHKGDPTNNKEEVEAAARKLLHQGVKESVLVKRGGSGSLLVTKDQSIEQGIFKASKVFYLVFRKFAHSSAQQQTPVDACLSPCVCRCYCRQRAGRLIPNSSLELNLVSLSKFHLPFHCCAHDPQCGSVIRFTYVAKPSIEERYGQEYCKMNFM